MDFKMTAAETLNENRELDEGQIAGIKRAIASLDRGESVPHKKVREWVKSWSRRRERPIPK
jgi:RHH-type transcriptional regulator, rel operon repressor / antitoxin RelB